MSDIIADTIHIAFALHDPSGTYAQHVGASLCSVCANTNWPLVAHILHDNTLTQENAEKLAQTAYQFNKEVYFYNLQGVLEQLPLAQHESLAVFSPATISRLFLPDILSDVTKIIYMDGDTIADLDIAELWLQDLAGNALAAVPDLGVLRARYIVPRDPTFDTWATMALAIWQSVGIPLENYFNAGVLLLDIEQLRTSGLFRQTLSVLTNNAHFPCPDQDALNAVFANNYTLLPFRYNVLMAFSPLAPAPAIWHYNSQKPWDSYQVARQERYMFYYAQTPWANRGQEDIGF